MGSRIQKGALGSLINIHWFPLASQGNVYSMSKLCSPSGVNRILVASLKRRIYSCEYHRVNDDVLRPIVKELLFTYIPNGAEIISIDAFNKQPHDEEFTIGITIIKPSGEGTVERYLNIYSETAGDGDNGETSIETIAQNCLSMELTYVPYLLYHTLICDREIGGEIVWLISGNDNQIHMIREDKLIHGYVESRIDKYFPELINLQALVLGISVYYYQDNKMRLTAIGCECGLVRVTQVDVESSKVLKEWVLRYDRPVSSVQIFSRYNSVPCDVIPTEGGGGKGEDPPILDILIVNSINSTIVFMDVLRSGMKNQAILPSMESTDSTLSSCIADINMDSVNEILLGTYSQEVFVYSFSSQNSSWMLLDKRKFDAPVHSMCYLDLTGDGMKELVVLTQRGVYILQHDQTKVNRLLEERMKELTIRLSKSFHET
ncbi:KICSTOR complex protein kaptin-like [Diachasmimorpha longicaudata]|uniref:KICSTOR complex protein kaptin-like n=1 Tax=Diachasmimorpha longicaudata TaxID=58733 RepID=UPI0030B8F22C